MAPGFQTSPSDTTPSPSPKKPLPLVVNANHQPATPISSITETIEEVRDAFLETEFAIIVSEKANHLRKSLSKAWNLSRNVAWVVGTSALVLVIPLLYEIDKELGPGIQLPESAEPMSSSSSSSPSSSSPDASSTPAGAKAAQ